MQCFGSTSGIHEISCLSPLIVSRRCRGTFVGSVPISVPRSSYWWSFRASSSQNVLVVPCRWSMPLSNPLYQDSRGRGIADGSGHPHLLGPLLWRALRAILILWFDCCAPAGADQSDQPKRNSASRALATFPVRADWTNGGKKL